MFLSILDPEKPDAQEMGDILKALKSGAVIIYPTDTGYAMGCSLLNKDATRRVTQIQKREAKKPYSLVCSGVEMAKTYASIDEFAEINLRHLLPGPYTFILKATKEVPPIGESKRTRVGIRVPRLPVTNQLVRKLGHPLISSTVRIEGKRSVDPLIIARQYHRVVDGIVDGGTIIPEETSVVDLSEGTANIIREGVGPVSFFRSN